MTSYTECNFAKYSTQQSHALVHTEINFLCRSLDRPTIKESLSNMQTQEVEKSRNLARVIKEKENKHENQIRSVQFGANAKTSCGSHVNPNSPFHSLLFSFALQYN